MKAYYALNRFRRERRFGPWILQIVANEARNRRRSAGRRAASSCGRLTFPRGRRPPPPKEPLSGEQREQAPGSLNDLREEDRLVIACRYFLDLSEEETAGHWAGVAARSSPRLIACP